jgi:hypothetical protein
MSLLPFSCRIFAVLLTHSPSYYLPVPSFPYAASVLLNATEDSFPKAKEGEFLCPLFLSVNFELQAFANLIESLFSLYVITDPKPSRYQQTTQALRFLEGMTSQNAGTSIDWKD